MEITKQMTLAIIPAVFISKHVAHIQRDTPRRQKRLIKLIGKPTMETNPLPYSARQVHRINA